MTDLGRREFIRVGAITAAAGAGIVRQSPSRPDTGQRSVGDPLRQSDWVGRNRKAVDSAENDPALVGLERRLKCICNCGLDVFTCRTTDFVCTYSPALHEEAVNLLRQNPSVDAAQAAFVAKYGERILMAPKPEGFGILGYLLPGTLVLAVGALLVFKLMRRSRRTSVAVAAPSPASPTTRQEEERLEQTLRDLEV